MTEYFTLVFAGDLTKFAGNPHLTDTPFGRPVASALGDKLQEIEEEARAAPDVGDAGVELVAGILCDFDDGGNWDGIRQATVHCGDCTNECHTCLLCQATKYREWAARIVGALSHASTAGDQAAELACAAWHNADLESSRAWTPWADCLPEYKAHVRTCITAALAAIAAKG